MKYLTTKFPSSDSLVRLTLERNYATTMTLNTINNQNLVVCEIRSIYSANGNRFN